MHKDIQHCIGTIGYLGGVTPHEEFCWSWGEMLAFNTQFLCGPGKRIHYTRARMSLHAGARNYLANFMIGDWVLMLDTDQRFVPETAMRMLQIQQRHQVPVLTGLQRHKVPPYHPLWWSWQEDQNGFVPFLEYDPNVQIMQIDACGGGCLLIQREVLQAMRQAFPDEEPFDHIGRYSEDFSFALRCRALNIPLYATPQVHAIHLRTTGVEDDDYIPGWFGEESQVQTIQVPMRV